MVPWAVQFVSASVCVRWTSLRAFTNTPRLRLFNGGESDGSGCVITASFSDVFFTHQ